MLSSVGVKGLVYDIRIIDMECIRLLKSLHIRNSSNWNIEDGVSNFSLIKHCVGVRRIGSGAIIKVTDGLFHVVLSVVSRFEGNWVRWNQFIVRG